MVTSLNVGNSNIKKIEVEDFNQITYELNDLYENKFDLLILKKYITNLEIKTLSKWCRDVISNTKDFNFKNLRKDGLAVIKDQRPKKQKVKGTMISINVGP